MNSAKIVSFNSSSKGWKGFGYALIKRNKNSTLIDIHTIKKAAVESGTDDGRIGCLVFGAIHQIPTPFPKGVPADIWGHRRCCSTDKKKQNNNLLLICWEAWERPMSIY